MCGCVGGVVGVVREWVALCVCVLGKRVGGVRCVSLVSQSGVAFVVGGGDKMSYLRLL